VAARPPLFLYLEVLMITVTTPDWLLDDHRAGAMTAMLRLDAALGQLDHKMTSFMAAGTIGAKSMSAAATVAEDDDEPAKVALLEAEHNTARSIRSIGKSLEALRRQIDRRGKGLDQSATDKILRAYEQLNARASRWARDFISLVDLRREAHLGRSEFDGAITDLRRRGVLSLSAAEGRHGISEEERQAGIREEGSLLLFATRRG
jgi:hypothetical protein